MGKGERESYEAYRVRRRALAAALALAAGSAPASAMAATCAWSVRLEGRGGPPLRALLVERNVLSSASPVCERALASVDAGERGFRLSLAVDGDQVTREVATIEDAAAWVESWLLPLVLDDSAREATASVAAAPIVPEVDRPAASEASERPAGRSSNQVGGRVALLGLTGLARDGAAWSGGELNGQLTLRDSLWFGAAFGGLADPIFGGESASGDGVRRRLIRASVRGGPRLSLGPRARLDLGLGGGMASAYVTGQSATGKLKDDEAVVFGEVVGLAEYRPHPNWVFLGGLTGGLMGPFEKSEGQEDENERSLPAGHPRLFGALTFGVGYTFVEGP